MRSAPLFTASGARTALLAAVVSSTVVLGGCATKGDLRNVQTEIRSLAARQDTLVRILRQQSAMTQDTLRTQSSQLVDMRGNISQQLREISAQLRTLEELAGQNQRSIAGIRDQLAAQRRATGPTVGIMDGAATEGGGAVSSGTTPSSEAATEQYNQAVRQFNRGSWTAARLGFQRLIEEHPNDELAPRAHYYLAEILVQEEEPEEAIEAFERIPELFPGDPKVPDALFRIGVLHLELGHREEGRRYLERVVNTYPDASVTPLARQRLDEIGGGSR